MRIDIMLNMYEVLFCVVAVDKIYNSVFMDYIWNIVFFNMLLQVYRYL